MNNHEPDSTELQTDALVDCPTCGLPAEITDRFTLGGAPGPVDHVRIVCVRKHWYTLPVDTFSASACESTAALRGAKRATTIRRARPDQIWPNALEEHQHGG